MNVPEDADCFTLFEGDAAKHIYGGDAVLFKDNGFVLPKGKWEIIGTLTKDRHDFDITDVFNCPEFNFLLSTDIKQYFKMHEHKFRFLLRSKGLYFENPIEVITKKDYPDWSEEKETRSRQAWQEAEQNLVHKLLILKKLS